MRQHDDEAHETKLIQLIGARTETTELAIVAKHAATVRAVAELCNNLECGAEEAEVIVRAAVIGRSWLVGPRIAEEVQHAIYGHVLPLAQAELADIEQHQVEAAQEHRSEQRAWHRFLRVLA